MDIELENQRLRELALQYLNVSNAYTMNEVDTYFIKLRNEINRFIIEESIPNDIKTECLQFVYFNIDKYIEINNIDTNNRFKIQKNILNGYYNKSFLSIYEDFNIDSITLLSKWDIYFKNRGELFG